MPYHLIKSALYLCLVFSCSQFIVSISDTCESTSPSIFRIEERRWKYYNFKSIHDLRIECDVSKYGPYLSIRRGGRIQIYLNFDQVGILNNSINVTAFLPLKENYSVTFQLFRIKGFDIEMPGPILVTDPRVLRHLDTTFNIYSSNLDFYYRGKLIDYELCNAELLDNLQIQIFNDS